MSTNSTIKKKPRRKSLSLAPPDVDDFVQKLGLSKSPSTMVQPDKFKLRPYVKDGTYVDPGRGITFKGYIPPGESVQPSAKGHTVSPFAQTGPYIDPNDPENVRIETSRAYMWGARNLGREWTNRVAKEDPEKLISMYRSVALGGKSRADILNEAAERSGFTQAPIGRGGALEHYLWSTSHTNVQTPVEKRLAEATPGIQEAAAEAAGAPPTGPLTGEQLLDYRDEVMRQRERVRQEYEEEQEALRAAGAAQATKTEFERWQERVDERAAKANYVKDLEAKGERNRADAAAGETLRSYDVRDVIPNNSPAAAQAYGQAERVLQAWRDGRMRGVDALARLKKLEDDWSATKQQDMVAKTRKEADLKRQEEAEAQQKLDEEAAEKQKAEFEQKRDQLVADLQVEEDAAQEALDDAEKALAAVLKEYAPEHINSRSARNRRDKARQAWLDVKRRRLRASAINSPEAWEQFTGGPPRPLEEKPGYMNPQTGRETLPPGMGQTARSSGLSEASQKFLSFHETGKTAEAAKAYNALSDAEKDALAKYFQAMGLFK